MRYGIRWNSVYPPFCRTFLSLSFFLIVRVQPLYGHAVQSVFVFANLQIIVVKNEKNDEK